MSAVVVNLGSTLTIGELDAIKSQLEQYLYQQQDFMLDAHELQHIDTAGVQFLCSLQQALESRRRRLTWYRPSPLVEGAAAGLGLTIDSDVAGGDAEDADAGFGFF